MKIKTDDIVLIALRDPREKIWGALREISHAGVFVKGIDLNSFEELVKATSNNTPFYGLSEQFLPMWRIERVAKDDADGDIPSMQQQFEERTGKLFHEI